MDPRQLPKATFHDFFSEWPLDILIENVDLDINSLFSLGAISKYLSNKVSQKFSKKLYDTHFLLDYLTKLSAKHLLIFTKKYYRPTDGILYQHLQKQIPKQLNTDKDYEVLLCYALLTNDVTKLNVKHLETLFSYIDTEGSYGYKYHIFSHCIKAICLYLNRDFENLKKMLLKKEHEVYGSIPKKPYGSSPQPHYHHFNLTNSYINLAGTSLSSSCLSTSVDGWRIGNVIDLRAANLENSKWQHHVLEGICFAGSNLEGAFFSAGSTLMVIKGCNFWQVNANNIVFNNIEFDCRKTEYQSEPFEFSEVNLEYARFENVRHLYLNNCNLKNAILKGIYFKEDKYLSFDFPFKFNVDLSKDKFEYIQLLESHEYETVEILSKKLTHLDKSFQYVINPYSFPNRWEYCDKISELRYAIANNIKRIIENLDMDIKIKLALLTCAIEHSIFKPRNAFRNDITNAIKLFNENYKPSYTPNQNILVAFRTELELEHSINKFSGGFF